MVNKECKIFMYNYIHAVKGVNAETRAKLFANGIKYMQQLLEQGHSEQQRVELAERTGLPLATIEQLVSRADLMRLRGVGSDLSYLLSIAGISSCRVLQHQQVEVLHKRLAEIHIGWKIAYHAPPLEQVRSWINKAKDLAETSPQGLSRVE